MIDVISWIGMVLILGAFGMLNLGKISASGWAYQVMNFVGSIFLAITAFVNNVEAIAWLNVTWFLVAGYGIYRLITRKTS